MKRLTALFAVLLPPLAAPLLLDACGSDDATCTNCGGSPEAGTQGDSTIPTSDAASDKDASTSGDARGDAGSDAALGDGSAGPTVKINEIFINTNLAQGDDDIEWVEIWGTAGTSLDGLKLRTIGTDGGVRFEVDVAGPGATLGSGNAAYWVVGGQSTGGLFPNKAYPPGQWGVDRIGAVQLVKDENGVKTPLDIVGYGGTVPPVSSPPTATSEGTPFSYAGIATRSIGRKKTDAGLPQDTGDNSVDFCEMNRSFASMNGDCQP
jgi:hypothetical protein